jgi:peptidoglycan/LPS O-acetylase OafA/YrhL
MTVYNPLYAAVCLALALLVAHKMTPWIRPDHEAVGRNAGLDGLRGLLAFMVFMSHAADWYGYRQTGRWELPPSAAWVYMAQASVAVFFMVTGYLFTGKLLASRTQPIDWVRLYTSRVLRLVPAYLLAMVCLFSIAAVFGPSSNADAATPWSDYLAWLLFSVPGTPDLLGLKDTPRVMAGVTWSLPYEWIFYFSLPALALLLRRQTSIFALLIGATLIAWIISSIPHYWIVYPMFAIGIIAGMLERSAGFRRRVSGRAGALVALACVAGAMWLSPTTSYAIGPLLLIGVAFLITACGNTFGGLLLTRPCQTLGAGTYGLYLLHGPVLFVGMHTGSAWIGPALDKPWVHWGTILLLTPCAVLAGLASYRWVEAPALRQLDAASRFISRCSTRRSA